MIDKNKIRQDLKDIRYYYGRKAIFDSVASGIGKNEIVDKLEIYNEVIRQAPPRLYDLYVCLYVQNCTQETVSDKWGYTIEHICRLNSKLIDFIYKNIKKEGEANV